MFWAESLLSFTLLSPPLYLPPFTLDNLGLMDTPALLPLLLLPHLPFSTQTIPKGEWTSLFLPLPPSLPPRRLFPLQFATFALTLLCHRGRMDITSIHWSPPCFLPVLHTFSLMPREALNPGLQSPPLWPGAALSAEPSHRQARPQTLTCICD